MKQNSGLCIECGESVTNPICPECIMQETLAILADKHIAGKLKEWEVDEINARLARVLKASYSEGGVDCIKCNTSFSICPHCVARYLKGILPLSIYSFLFSYFSFLMSEMNPSLNT